MNTSVFSNALGNSKCTVMTVLGWPQLPPLYLQETNSYGGQETEGTPTKDCFYAASVLARICTPADASSDKVCSPREDQGVNARAPVSL